MIQALTRLSWFIVQDTDELLLKKFKLTRRQFILLDFFYKCPNLNQTQISKICRETKSSITQKINYLENKNWVKRNHKNKKECLITLTDIGRNLHFDISESLSIQEQKLYFGLNQFEKQKIQTIIEQINNNLGYE